jgi:hypothetical protein
MLTIYLIGAFLAMVVVSALDPRDEQDDYLHRGLFALFLGVLWVPVALWGITVLFLRVLGWTGDKLMTWLQSRWPHIFV